MELFSEGLSDKVTNSTIKLERNPNFLTPADLFQKKTEPAQEKTLPSLQLTKENFAATAKEAFKYVDVDNDSRLTYKELSKAYKYPAAAQSDKVTESIKIMYEKFEFLSELGQREDAVLPKNHTRADHLNIASENEAYSNSISAKDLDRAQDVLSGRVGNEPLIRRHREDGKSNGFLVGVLPAFPGYIIGASGGMAAAEAIGAGTALTFGIATVGGVIGIAAPVLAAGAIGYGIGYLRDKAEAKKHQAREVNSFLSAFAR